MDAHFTQQEYSLNDLQVMGTVKFHNNIMPQRKLYETRLIRLDENAGVVQNEHLHVRPVARGGSRGSIKPLKIQLAGEYFEPARALLLQTDITTIESDTCS